MADYVEGKDFEFREVKGKDGKVLYKNRHFFTKAEKEALKAPKATPSVKAATKATTTTKPKSEAKSKKSQTPSSSPRPKSKEATKEVNMVRPEGKASGMPAAKPKGIGKEATVAAAAVGASRAALNAGKGASGGFKAPVETKTPTAKIYNPSFTGKMGAPEGFRGAFETGVARAGGGGRAGGTPIGIRKGRGARIVKLPDILELQNMNKGGMVKKKGKK